MKKPLSGIRSGTFFVLGIFFLILLLTHTDLAMDGVRRGLSLCAETLFPSLFPFLVLSELLVAMQAGEILGRVFSRPVRCLFGLSGNAAAALLLGTLCGFPTAMSTGAALYERGEIGKAELQRLLLFANNPSSGFLIGAVGEALFGNRRAGLALFCITVTSSVLIGIFLRLVFGAPAEKSENNPPYVVRKGLSPSDFTGSVRRGFSTLLQVAAFLLFFSAVIGCLRAIPAFSALPSCLSVLFAGILEMTSGISLSVSTLSAETAFLLTAFFSGFAGLSVCLQLFSVCEGKELRLLPYLLSKTVQGGLNLALAKLYLLLAKPELVLAKGVFAAGGGGVPSGWRLFLPSLAVLLVCGAGYFYLRQKRKSPKAKTDLPPR